MDRDTFKGGEATEECSRQQTEVSNRLVTVVDVPGWGGRTGGINSRESEARDRTERHALSTWTSCISTGIESGRNHPSTGGARALGAFGRGSLEKYASFVHEG